MPQLLVQVVCKKGPSLRERISNDKKWGEFEFEVGEQERKGRARGWTKIRSTLPDRWGALNLAWDAGAAVLICRIVNRRQGTPNKIVSDLVDYLFERRRRRIQAINIYPRE
jgi:hypothetical protein